MRQNRIALFFISDIHKKTDLGQIKFEKIKKNIKTY
jgi:hypothetical protein